MATVDTTPAPSAAGSAYSLAAQQVLQQQRLNTDAGVQQGRLTQQFQQQAPKLKSAIASAGQFYGTARQDAETDSYNDFLNGSYDIQSALQRNLQDLDATRMQATLGLVV